MSATTLLECPRCKTRSATDTSARRFWCQACDHMAAVASCPACAAACVVSAASRAGECTTCGASVAAACDTSGVVHGEATSKGWPVAWVLAGLTVIFAGVVAAAALIG